MSGSARRSERPGALGFRVPDAKGETFGSMVDTARGLAAKGETFDYGTSMKSVWDPVGPGAAERRPRGVLKRKGEVIGGFGVPVRPSAVDVGEICGFDVDGKRGRVDSAYGNGGVACGEVYGNVGKRGKGVLKLKGEGAFGGGYRSLDSGRDGFDEEVMHGVVGRKLVDGSGGGDWRERERMGVAELSLGKRMESGIEVKDEVIKVVGRGGVLKYRPSNNKKVVDMERTSVRTSDHGLRKSFDDAPYVAASYERLSVPRESMARDEVVCLPVPRENKVRDEVVCLPVPRENKVRDEMVCLPVPRESKVLDEAAMPFVHVKDHVRQKDSSPIVREVVVDTKKLPERKPDVKESEHLLRKSSCNTELEVSGSMRRHTGAKKISRGSEKQKVREQIKNMLLDAGWKIELRPRKNRDYQDSVYVSPQGTGYWSITKAYDAYQLKLKGATESDNSNADNSARKSTMPERSTKSLGVLNGSSSALPGDALSILKRNVVNKRSSKRDHKDKIEKPAGWLSACGKKKNALNLNVKLRSGDNDALECSEGHCSPGGKKKKFSGCALVPRKLNQGHDPDTDGYIPYAGKRTVLAWMIDSETLPAGGKVMYMHKKKPRVLLDGWITREGIHCSCCSKILSVSKFEIHAGSKQRQPYQNIFVDSSGLSLFQCLLAAWRNQQEKHKGSGFSSSDLANSDPNDDTCGICGDGGDLICCDGCPSTFHLSCLDIEMLPHGDWHCFNCICKFCGEVDCSTSCHTSSSNLLSCFHCGSKYHQDCVSDAISTEQTISISFCGLSCKKIYEKLQKLLGVKNELDSGFSWSLIKRSNVDNVACPPELVQRAECNAKVAVALQVIEECFLPVVDQRSGINLINNIVFNCGSNLHRLDFHGVYTFILEREDEIISAAPIRICGTRLAEMLFIGTRVSHRNQGMCHLLINAIETALVSLEIEKLVTPSLPELVNMWTSAFDFRPLDGSLKHEREFLNMAVFPGMSLLMRTLPQRKNSKGDGEAQRILGIVASCGQSAAFL